MDNDDAVWQAIDSRRLALADVLDQLNEREWRHPSLCEGWTVRDVAAHLTLQQVTLVQALSQALRARGGMNRMIHDAAVRRSAAPPDELTAAIRGMVGSRRHNVGVTCHETLIDIVVHGQDVAVPLGRPLPVPVDAAATAATRVWKLGWPFRAARRFEGFHLVAIDTAWESGVGARVEGPIEALLLVLTGRLVALNRLGGPGADGLRARLTP